jgi:fimbrial isopeptide formation D2 family protein/LPXTG-motif cell wall-anchored protein
MKHLRKMMALVISMLVSLSMFNTAFAADGDHLATAEDKITAENVVAGDSVEYYQLVEWKEGNWALTTLGAQCGVTLAALKDGITEEEATTIANSMVGKDPTGNMTQTSTNTTYEATVAAGLYYLHAIAAANNKDTIYNPAFVSADYTEGGNKVSFNSTISGSSVLKKSSIPFDKEVDSTNVTDFVDVKPGDIIPYKITTTIPSFGTAYTKPVFKVNDTFSNGLALKIDDDHKFTVTYGSAGTTEVTNDYVTITATTGQKTFEVAFKEDYLKGLNGVETSVTITYYGEVTTEALDNVTYLDNKAKLTFSNTPTTTTDKDDITRHYTFSIDGNLLGATEDQTDELIKVACDADGNPIYETKTTYYDKQVNPLDGASFTLTPVDGTPGVAKTVDSANGGHIQFLGLDAGNYELVENSAPAGYVKDSKTYLVSIVPQYDNTDVDNPILVKYDVVFKVKNDDGTYTDLTTATFTATASGTGNGATVTSSNHAQHTQVLGNTPGAELPSTGGIGTTIFYVVGATLVVGAGVLLVTRRRMSVDK